MSLEDMHEPGLLSFQDIESLAERFVRAWSAETCYPPLKAQWSQKNPALGQCAVTALIVQDLYGGAFAEDKINNHIWNILPDGSHHDFSRTQFDDHVVIEQTSTKIREEILGHPRAVEARTGGRYTLLKQAF